ncbi:EboA domain-containing protein [bacterium]|nr:EboA domain-containing protein [bacterium]
MPIGSAVELLSLWLRERIPSVAWDWFHEKMAAAQAGDGRSLALGFSMASRRVGKEDLRLSEADLKKADAARAGWDPSLWTIDQSARVLLVLSLWKGDVPSFVTPLDRLFAASDVGELVALYQGLPLYPEPSAHRWRAAEGVRTNMKAIFEAVALRNPYPADELDAGCWNQMVLKSLFIGSTLDQIVGLDRRANRELARMLWDYARERRAASRSISPELWRCVGPFLDDLGDDVIVELARRLKSDFLPERQGTALCLAANPHPRAQGLLVEDPLAREAIARGEWTWKGVAEGSSKGTS